ncbi:response regulator [Turneriella parva]|uniref:Response regulator receiver protein n=1 Tax=Turneriella parva (strain ATCC BAA-1111 / DSM 21527 / NCTC 11395 / H) TaxID=869212 RepID=I4B3D6_TURPD|nr:response regulator [Turneriella parva]AFM11793.1 response regulator receiver protein [Turneriella parva DSM 21527]
MDEVEILLVEDNADDLEMALFAFREANIANRIQVARDGQEALDFIFGDSATGGARNGHYPKVILLDLKLPKVDGFEVLRRLKATEATKTIPVVILTSSKEHRDMIESYNLGVNSYIVKPVNFENFANVIKELGFYWLVLNQRVQ